MIYPNISTSPLSVKIAIKINSLDYATVRAYKMLKKSCFYQKMTDFTITFIRLPSIPAVILGFFLVFIPVGVFSQNSPNSSNLPNIPIEEPTFIEKWFYPVTALSKSATRMLDSTQKDTSARNQAITLFEKALANKPSDGIVAYNLANAYQIYSKFAKAEKTYHLALENLGYGTLPVNANDTRSYLARIRRAGSKNRSYLAKIFFNQGNNYFKQEKFLEALTSYKYSLTANPNDLNAKHNFELTLQKLEENAAGGATNPQSEQSQQNQNEQNSNQEDNSSANDNAKNEENQNANNPENQESPGQQSDNQVQNSAKTSDTSPDPSANNTPAENKEQNAIAGQREADNNNRKTDNHSPASSKNSQSILSLERAEQILDGYQNRQKKFEIYKKYPQNISRDPNHKNW